MYVRDEDRNIAGARMYEECRHADQVRQDVYTAQRAWQDANRYNKPIFSQPSEGGSSKGGNLAFIILMVVIGIIYGIYYVISGVVHFITHLF
jgi:hypothetical protein